MFKQFLLTWTSSSSSLSATSSWIFFRVSNICKTKVSISFHRFHNYSVMRTRTDFIHNFLRSCNCLEFEFIFSLLCHFIDVHIIFCHFTRFIAIVFNGRDDDDQYAIQCSLSIFGFVLILNSHIAHVSQTEWDIGSYTLPRMMVTSHRKKTNTVFLNVFVPICLSVTEVVST